MKDEYSDECEKKEKKIQAEWESGEKRRERQNSREKK